MLMFLAWKFELKPIIKSIVHILNSFLCNSENMFCYQQF